MEGVITCRVCGQVIGVYEPLVIVIDDTRRQTSLAREPQLAEGDNLIHQTCAATTI